ncbi:MAG: hypothetical protein A2W80_18490 [Candidatus Riflebacteria bacterium GWC2_50_8]|nr:MAG: hypothetical protein A2W80_18490 [Candidatus Riflebacteria bacterium GWC2_50_8]
MRSWVFGLLLFALLNSTVCFSEQRSFISGQSLGTLKLGISEREARKVMGSPAKILIKKNRIVWKYQNLSLIDSSVTTLSFEKRSLTQIETSNPKVLFQGKPLVDCTVANFLTEFPDSKRLFVQLSDFPDPSIYYFDSTNGIGMSFNISMGNNFGKGSAEELALETVFVFPAGYAPIFPEDPIKEDQSVVIPGVSIARIAIGASEEALESIGDTIFEDEQNGFISMYVGDKLVYLSNGKVAQISTKNFSSSVGNKTPLLESLHEFLNTYPNARIAIRSIGTSHPAAFVYDIAEGIGLSFAVKHDQIVKGFFSKEIVPAYLSGSCLFVFQKGTQPPVLQGIDELAQPDFPLPSDTPIPAVIVTTAGNSDMPYFLDETSSEPTRAFLSLPLFSTTFIGWEAKEAPLNISVSDFIAGLFPGEKIPWKKTGNNAFSFSVETADRLIEAKTQLSLSFEVKQNPQRALLFTLFVDGREVQGTEFINTITAMTHFALKKRGARLTTVNWK